MSENTESESLFEQFCDCQQIRRERVLECSVQQPDYEIFPCNNRVVVEVKQLDLNAEEKEFWSCCNGENVLCRSVVIGKRVRRKIEEAMGQVKSRIAERVPALIVLFDNTGFPMNLDPYSSKVAMYGFEAVKFAVRDEVIVAPDVSDRGFAPRNNKTVSPNKNTELSAVAVLKRVWQSETSDYSLSLTFYHNVHCHCPFIADWWRSADVSHVTLGTKRPNQNQEWISC